VVRVPLIVAAPGRLPAGRVVETLGRTIDIMPTVIDLLGLPVPEGLDGVSLAPWARGLTRDPGPPAYSESGRNFYKENPRQHVPGVAGKWRMMRDDRFKLILIPDVPEPQWELYDLVNDPGETKNLVAEKPQEADRLRKMLMAIVAKDPMRDDREEPALPEGLEEDLRSLGYVGGGPSK
jgi:arylsulfatase